MVNDVKAIRKLANLIDPFSIKRFSANPKRREIKTTVYMVNALNEALFNRLTLVKDSKGSIKH